MTSPKTVLAVDDEPMARDIVEGFLFQDGYQFLFASDGPETLAILEDQLPDIILLDVMMPEMDGFTVCQRIKSNDRWRHIPVILVTALGEKEDLLRGNEAGADDFIQKPVKEIELRTRVRSLLRIKEQYDQVQHALRLREDLAHMIVHDMRSPLTAILGYSSLLQAESALSKDSREDLDKIYAHALRLNSFLNDMLLVAKMEDAGSMVLYKSSVKVNRLVKEVIDQQAIIANLKHCKLASQLPDESPMVSIDGNLFRRVLDNLISNAIKYSDSEDTITVRVEVLEHGDGTSDPKIRIQVMDHGPGIAPEYRDRIFEKYEIVAMPRQDKSQIGLGLVFCKMVVDAHQGKIFVTENQPTGSIFTIEI